MASKRQDPNSKGRQPWDGSEGKYDSHAENLVSSTEDNGRLWTDIDEKLMGIMDCYVIDTVENCISRL